MFRLNKLPNTVCERKCNIPLPLLYSSIFVRVIFEQRKKSQQIKIEATREKNDIKSWNWILYEKFCSVQERRFDLGAQYEILPKATASIFV